MSRYLVFLFYFNSFLTSGFSQTNEKPDKEVTMSKYTSMVIKLAVPEKKYHPAIPLSGIIVYDVRFDTLSCGFVDHSVAEKEKLIHLHKRTSLAVNEYLSSLVHLSPPGEPRSYQLVCFIKKLFLSNDLYINGGKPVNSTGIDFEVKSGGMAVLEFYAKRDADYLPLYRLDTIITGSKTVYDNGRRYLEDLLAASVSKLETLNAEKIKTRQPKTFEQIDFFYTSRFKVPVLSEMPRRGLYVNFESFKNNTPVDTPFTVDKSSKGDFLYIKNAKNEDVLQTEIWGYSDGKDMYIFSAENYFKLYRYVNSFVIYGAKDFTSTRALRLNFGLLDVIAPNSTYAKTKTKKTYRLVFKLYQLDMDTGELY